MNSTVEKEIASLLARTIKKYFGKGPQNIEINLTKNYLLVRYLEIFPPIQQKLLLHDQKSCQNCKANQLKQELLSIFKEELLLPLEDLLSRKIFAHYCDFLPENNSMIRVIYFE